MNKLFKAVRQNDLETVKSILEAKPELINSVATPPPKRDNENSLLQVANKAHSWEIAHYLIDKGIDVNYIPPDHGLPMTQCWVTPVLNDVVIFLFINGWTGHTYVEERLKLLRHLLEKGADPNIIDNRKNNAWDCAINEYCDTRTSVKGPEEAKLYEALFQQVLEILYPYVNILDIDRVNKDLEDSENYSLFLKNLILNRDDLYGVTPRMLGMWEECLLPLIPILKPFYMRNNPYYEKDKYNVTERIFGQEGNAMSKQPDFPFDITGYTCFSIINRPVEQVVQLLREYSNISSAEDRVSFLFQIAVLPEETKWTLLRWPRPWNFYALMNLTMWLRGYEDDLGEETPLFVAMPPTERTEEGPLLARPEYDNGYGDTMLGFWQNWSFAYIIPREKMRWIGENVFPQDHFLNGYGYSSTGFRLEWLEHLERISNWIECSVLVEKDFS